MRPALVKLLLLLLTHGRPWRCRFVARNGSWQLVPWCVLLSLALTATVRASEPATRPAAVTVSDGRLVATCQGTDETWAPAPGGYWDSYVAVRSEGGSVEVEASRSEMCDWTIIRLVITQGPRETSAFYTVRTPIFLPDAVLRFSAPNLPLLLVRVPELLPMLDEVLYAAGSPPYTFDAVVRAEAHPETYRPGPGTVAAVAKLLPGLGSGDWRERERAVAELAGMGEDAAIYCRLGLDRSALTVAQRLSIDAACSRWCLLTESDRAALKKLI